MQQALRTLGGTHEQPATIEKALSVARRVVTLAEHAEIERAVRVIMVAKGKTYSQVVEKNLGQALEIGMDLLGIDKMLLDMRITRDELDAVFQIVNRTKWTHTTYTPLPEVADWAQMLKEHREKNMQRWSLAHDLIKAADEAKRIPDVVEFTPEKLRAALELGLWTLMYPEHQTACWMLLDWQELPHYAKAGYYKTLSNTEKRKICALPTAPERELRTQKYFEAQYGNG